MLLKLYSMNKNYTVVVLVVPYHSLVAMNFSADKNLGMELHRVRLSLYQSNSDEHGSADEVALKIKLV